MEQISKNLQATESTEPLSQDLRTRILAEAAKHGKPAPSGPISLSGPRANRRLSPALVGAICAAFAVVALFVMHPWEMEQREVAAVSLQSAFQDEAQRSDRRPAASAPVAQMQKSLVSSAGTRESVKIASSHVDLKASDQDGQVSDKWANGNPVGLRTGPTVRDDSGAVKVNGDTEAFDHPDSSSAGFGGASHGFSPGGELPRVANTPPATVDGYRANANSTAPSNGPTAEASQSGQIYYATPPSSAAGDSAKAEVSGRGGANGTTDKIAAPQPPAGAAGNGTVYGLTLNDVSLDRQVHREASVTVQMKDPEAASDQVNQMVKDAGGYVANNNLTTDDSGIKSAQMTLKVPVAQFDTILNAIEKLGNVTAKNVTGEDITGKVSDASQAESVLDDEANRAAARLQSLGRHAKWSDVEDARELRIELAQARARVQLLRKLATLSDISVILTQTPKPTPPAQSGFLDNLKGNGSSAFQSLVGSVEGLLTMLIWALAYAPIWGPVAFAVWYAVRRKREQSQLSGV